MITQGMWQMLSDLLDGEKLPDPLNKAIYDLCEGKAVVVRELTDEEIVDALCLNDEDFMIYIATSPQAKEKLIQRGRAVLKCASGNILSDKAVKD